MYLLYVGKVKHFVFASKKTVSIKFLTVSSTERTRLVKVGVMDFHMHAQGSRGGVRCGGGQDSTSVFVLPGIFSCRRPWT